MRNRVCSLATVDGRITLTPREFIVTRNGAQPRRWRMRRAYARLLHTHFGIDAPTPQSDVLRVDETAKEPGRLFMDDPALCCTDNYIGLGAVSIST
ncbi:MAG: hypothetical protein R2851_22170 [Caldilineaceae bacterium]